MTRRSFMNGVFAVAFTVFLVDGAAAIWLGQVRDLPLVVLAGLLLLFGAVVLAFWHRRWLRDLEIIDRARRERRDSYDQLRVALENPRAFRNRN